ncbi:S-layer homology domain-containing protein [Paenibacillus sp. CAU 1782]
MKRTVLVLIIACLFLAPSQLFADSPQFTDVKANQWFATPIAWAVENKIVVGFPDGSFRPNAPVTEEQFLIMLSRAAKTGLEPYEDAKQRNMPIYYKLNLPLDRNETAVYLAANLGFKHEKDLVSESVAFLYEHQIARGLSSSGQTDLSQYGGTKQLTRAEAVTLLQRATEASLTFGAKLDQQPEVQYPKSVIFNGEAPTQFIKAISNLPAFEGLRLDTGHYDATFATVAILEDPVSLIDSSAFILATSKDNPYVTVFLRNVNEVTIAAAKAVLAQYVGQSEAEELLNKHLEVRDSKAANSSYEFESSSNYTVRYTTGNITIHQGS